MPHVVLAGYFGCGNLGDEAVLLGFADAWRELGGDVTALSERPEDTNRRLGLRAVYRKSPGDIRQALSAADAMVFPGGSIFQDSTSVRSVGYYANLVQLAKRTGKRVFLVGQGVGPLRTFFGKRLAASAFAACDFIAVRDPDSLQALQDLGVKVRAKVTADTAFLLPASIGGTAEDTGFQVGEMKTVGIAPRPLPGWKDRDTVKLYGELARGLMQAGLMPVFLEMDSEIDGPLIVEISKSQGGKVPEIRKLGSPLDAQTRISRMDAIVAVRLHAGILAAKVGVPPYLVGYDPKVVSFAKMLGVPRFPSLEGLTSQRLIDGFLSFYKERDRHRHVLESKTAELTTAARENVELVREALGFR